MRGICVVSQEFAEFVMVSPEFVAFPEFVASHYFSPYAPREADLSVCTIFVIESFASPKSMRVFL